MRMCDPRWFWMGLLLAAPAVFAAEESAMEVRTRLAAVFEQADINRDKKLSLGEFLVGRDDIAVAKRDFRLCDFNDDQRLSIDEFLTVPTIVEARHRAPLPDIITGLIDQICVALDAACDNWDKDPRRELNSRQFILALSSQFERLGNGLMRPDTREVDPDGSGTVTRAEARRFIEMQMGIRHSQGELLRFHTGQVINLALFQQGDPTYRQSKLALEEFAERMPAGVDAAAEFAKADLDRNKFVSLEEWFAMGGIAVIDPVEDFRRLDTNLDARVDPQELLSGTPAAQQSLAKSVFPGFDWNKDGVLSLTEYRTTMQANPILPWHIPLDDKNTDGDLSLAEFQFETRSVFPLLRMLYFQRLDANGNKILEPSEWSFHTKAANAFFLMNEDGTGWKELYSFKGHKTCRSPAVSPDGKTIAFDAWVMSNKISTIYVMPIEGGLPTQLETGSFPSWKPDSKHFVCCRSGFTPGLYIMESQKPAAFRHITQGWGGQWSPDGKQIAFTDRNIIKLYDVEKETVKTVFEEDASPYEQIFWNMAWSPDCRQLCFKGVTRAGSQDVTVFDLTAEKPVMKVHHTGKHAVNADFAWHPTQSRIVFAMHCAERKRMQLYESDPTNDDPPKLMDGQDATRNNTDACWTSDGKRLIIISGDF